MVEFKPPVFNAPLNDILPLTIPVPLLTSLLSKSKLVTFPPAVDIVISLLLIVPLRFCCWKLKIIDVGSAEVSAVSSNANTCESKLPINNLADVPSGPVTPCLDLTKLIVFDKETLAEVAVIITEPLSFASAPIFTVFGGASDELTPAPLDADIV